MSAQTALAATLVEPGHYELREYPVAEPARDCLLVKMEVSGICGTDKHTYQGHTGQYGGTGVPRQIPFPIIQGHENIGTVAAIGGDGHYTDFEGITLKVGDQMSAAESVITAGTTFLIIAAKTQSITETTLAPKSRRIFSAAGRSTCT
jgi:L-iditol 2-dehydrogenase